MHSEVRIQGRRSLAGEFTSFRGRTQAVIRVGNDEKLKICVTTEKEQVDASFDVVEN